jgi:hypothetical protein
MRAHDEFAFLQTEISLCRVYKRTGIDDGHGHHPASARSTPSRGGATAAQQQDNKQASSSYEQSSRNANYAFAASTYSLLSLVNAASMGGSGSAAAIDELSTLVGHVHGPPAYFSHQAAGGGHGHSFLPLPAPSSQQPMALGTLPMSLGAISDKMIWDWNPIPDAAARDYGSAGGFK